MRLVQPNNLLTVCGILLVALVQRTALGDENWPQWRGPDARGVAAAGDYPVKFSSEENVAWKVELPGLGCSTPAVWGDSIFVTCGIDGKDGCCCYGMDGKELWRKELGPERPGKHRNGSGSNPSPVTDGKHVVVYFKSGTLACLDLAGQEMWHVNLQEKFGADTLWWDLGTSPVLAGDRVCRGGHAGGRFVSRGFRRRATARCFGRCRGSTSAAKNPTRRIRRRKW